MVLWAREAAILLLCLFLVCWRLRETGDWNGKLANAWPRLGKGIVARSSPLVPVKNPLNGARPLEFSRFTACAVPEIGSKCF